MANMKIADTLVHFFGTIPPELGTLFLSMLPVTETRISLPVALAVYHLSIPSALFWTFVGNVLVIPICFVFFTPMLQFTEKKIHWLHHFLDHHVRSVEKKYKTNYLKFGSLFLFFLVAIPLPGMGMWPAALLAVVFEMKSRQTIVAMICGQIMALFIVLLLTQGGIALLR